MDVNIIIKIISSGTLAEKCALFEELEESILNWDIIPIDIISQGFDDPAPEVRQATVELFCDAPQNLPQMPWLKLSKMIGDPDSIIRKTAQKKIEFIAQGLSYQDVNELIHNFKHNNSFARDAFIQLFYLIPEHFDEPLCMKLIEMYHRGTIKIRNIISEFLDTYGQGHLINIDYEEE